MKKLGIIILFAAAAVAVGALIVRFAGTKPAPASSSSLPQAAGPSAAAPSSVPSSQAEAPASSSASQAGGSDQQAMQAVKSQVRLDWNKYTLKAAQKQKTAQGKAYRTYELWDSDYQQGISILVDPDDGKVYTLGPSDSSPVPAATDKAFDKTPHTVTGTMVDGAMMSVQLKLPDGNQITVRRLGVDTSGLKSMKIGDKIKVTYTGVINGSDTSRAFVTKLESVG
jgi:pyruvate/2-oxoglutarate dehydrogenase complex dihydrolipoamide acyltransferase (E2) component